jgi:hypothetical protein
MRSKPPLGILHILGCKLEMTCSTSPEQFDVFLDGTEIGYLRLRHGSFSVHYVPADDSLYTVFPKGDGCFDDEERVKYLTEAVEALQKRHLEEEIKSSRNCDSWDE